jgi:hypothetical protein
MSNELIFKQYKQICQIHVDRIRMSLKHIGDLFPSKGGGILSPLGKKTLPTLMFSSIGLENCKMLWYQSSFLNY